MEFDILYAIQGIRSSVLDNIVLVITSMVGSYGQLWPIIGIILCIPKKTRTCGIALLVSYLLVFLSGQLVLKTLIARPRPYHIDDTVALLVQSSDSSSFPSTHTGWSFAAATVIFMNHRKAGVAAIVFACAVAFTRLYLFVHFPTDVMCGAILGIICGYAAVKIVSWIKI